MMRKERPSSSLALLPVRDYADKEKVVQDAPEIKKGRKFRIIQSLQTEDEMNMRARKLGERLLQIMTDFTSILHVRLGADSRRLSKAELPIAPQVKEGSKASRVIGRRIRQSRELPDKFDITMLLPAPKLPGKLANKRVRVSRNRRKRRLHANIVPKASQITWDPHTVPTFGEDVVELREKSSKWIDSSTPRVECLQRLKKYTCQIQASAEKRNKELLAVAESSNITPEKRAKEFETVTAKIEDRDKALYEHNELPPLLEEQESLDQSDHDLPDNTLANGKSFSGSSSEQEQVLEVIVDSKRQKHTPAWITPELRAWLIDSGIYTLRLRSELAQANCK
uniref:AlNc14C249G9615 protein n=1 Tax=Albugo laibachii Nc14 TaxID=890382 RepID=F0WTD5_9STRA|nr:AlNc14C249G9615 [Albugo laibachii Nc14]|eukprot:CCA24625.1 AlNc14C249G9615 [Albugo laibachii Nc14]